MGKFKELMIEEDERLAAEAAKANIYHAVKLPNGNYVVMHGKIELTYLDDEALAFEIAKELNQLNDRKKA